MKKLFIVVIAFAVSTTAWAGGGGIKKVIEKAKAKRMATQAFEPTSGFSSFSEMDEDKLKNANYVFTGESVNGSGQQIGLSYSKEGSPGDNVYVEKDPVTGAVKKVTHVIESVDSKLLTTNQIDYVEGTLSHCSNMDSKKKKKKSEAKITCSTVTRDICSRGGEKKDVKGIQPKHLANMSSQMSRVKSVPTGRREMENLAKNGDVRKKLCQVFDAQPMHVVPPAQQPVATPPADGGTGTTPPPTSTVPAAPTAPDDGIYRAPQPGSQ